MTARYNLFQEIILAGNFSGFGFITDKSVTKARLFVSRAYVFSVLVILSISCILAISIFWTFTEKGLPNISILIMNTYAMMLVVYYMINRERIVNNFNSFVELKEVFCLYSEQGENSFYAMLGKYSKSINGFVRYLFWFNFMMVPLNSLVKILSRFQIIDMNKDNYIIYEVSFNATSKEVFWPTLIIQASSIHLVVVTQMFNDLYIFNVTVLQVLLFRYLRFELGSILRSSKIVAPIPKKLQEGRHSSLRNPVVLFRADNYFYKQDGDFDEIGPKVKRWIDYHTHLLRLCNEFVQLYYPILLAYFVNKFIGVSFGMFMITQGADDFYNVVEYFIIISYYLGNGICLLALCMAGTYLTHESSGVFDDAFHCPWYRCLPITKTNLYMIACMAKKPVRLTPLCSQTIEMTLDTFIWVIRAMISYYMALTQVKAAFKTIE